VDREYYLVIRSREATVPNRLVAGEPLGRCTASGLVLEIEMPQRLAGGVADDEAFRVLVDRSKAAGRGVRTACSAGPVRQKCHPSGETALPWLPFGYFPG